MSEGIDQKPECEHAWAHKSTSVGLWVPQCYLCGEFNNADLGQQIAKVKAEALREAAMRLRDGIGSCNTGCHVSDMMTLQMLADRIEEEA